MNVSFADRDLQRLEIDVAFAAGYSRSVVKAFRKRMQLIRAARDERDLRVLKSLHFERLMGNRRHQHSLRLNDQWRLIVEIQDRAEGRALVVVEIADYH